MTTVRAIQDIPKYTNTDIVIPSPDVRTALQRDNHWLERAEIDELVEAYEAGANLTDLGRQFRVHRKTARRHLLDRGVTLRPIEPALSGKSIAELVVLYESGLSTYKLAAQFDANPNTIRLALIAAGVRMRSRSGR
jgi:hypothetical protein